MLATTFNQYVGEGNHPCFYHKKIGTNAPPPRIHHPPTAYAYFNNFCLRDMIFWFGNIYVMSSAIDGQTMAIECRNYSLVARCQIKQKQPHSQMAADARWHLSNAAKILAPNAHYVECFAAQNTSLPQTHDRIPPQIAV